LGEASQEEGPDHDGSLSAGEDRDPGSGAGYGGTLWKTLAKKSAKTKTYHLNQRPRGLVLPVSTNLRQGLSSYRVKVTVRVIRDVRLALDTTAWKMTLHSAAFLCWSPGVA